MRRPRAPRRARACGSRSTRRSTPRDRSVDASPRAHLPGADHEHRRAVERAEVLGRDRDRGRRDRHRVPADAGLGAHPLARLDRVPEQPRQQLRRGCLRAPRPATRRGPGRGSRSRRRSSSRDRPRPRTGARPRRRRSTCRGGRRSRRGRHRSSSARKSRDVADRGVEVRAARVDLGAVARREHDDLEQVLAGARGRAAPSASCSSGTVIRSSSSTGTVRWFRPTTIRDTSSRAPSPRRRARRGRGPRCPSRTPAANRRLRSNAPRPAALPGPRRAGRAASRTQGRSPRSSGRRRWAASAGLRPPVPIATTRSARRTTDISVNEQLAGSSALLTQTRARLARREHRRVDRRVVGGGEREPGAVEVGGLRTRRSTQRAAARVGPGPHLGADRGRDDDDLGAEVEQRLDLAGRDAARRRRPRPAGRGRAGSPGSPASPGASDPLIPAVARGRRRRGGAAPQLVEGEDLQLDREVDLAHRDALGHREHRGREVEDRADAGGDEPVGDLLGDRRGRGEDADRDLALVDDAVEVVDRLDVEVADLLARRARGRRRRAPRPESRGRRSRGSSRAPGRGCRCRRSRPASRG